MSTAAPVPQTTVTTAPKVERLGPEVQNPEAAGAFADTEVADTANVALLVPALANASHPVKIAIPAKRTTRLVRLAAVAGNSPFDILIPLAGEFRN